MDLTFQIVPRIESISYLYFSLYALESVSYDFGPGRGVILFTYPEDRRPDTRGDTIAFGFFSSDPDAVLLRIESAKSSDYLEIELVRMSSLILLPNSNIFSRSFYIHIYTLLTLGSVQVQIGVAFMVSSSLLLSFFCLFFCTVGWESCSRV